MCTYGLSCDEIIEPFEEWLIGQEGEVSAEELAKAWNKLARKCGWTDRLKAIETWKPHKKLSAKDKAKLKIIKV